MQKNKTTAENIPNNGFFISYSVYAVRISPPAASFTRTNPVSEQKESERFTT